MHVCAHISYMQDTTFASQSAKAYTITEICICTLNTNTHAHKI